VTDRNFLLSVNRHIARLIPNSLPGKMRLARALIQLSPAEQAVHLPDRFGNVIYLPSLREPMALSLFGFGVYEPETVKAILDRLPLTGTYVDIGANIGVIALPIAALRPAARVVCVEADPTIAGILRRNVTANKRSNITIVEILAGSTDDRAVSFYPAPIEKFGMGSIGPQFELAPIMLQQRAIDDMLGDLGIDRVDVVKLDVEGAELGALRGMKLLLTGASPPVIVFEFVDWAENRIAGQVAGDAQRFLLSLGYRLFTLSAGEKAGVVLSCPLTAGFAMILGLPPTGDGMAARTRGTER